MPSRSRHWLADGLLRSARQVPSPNHDERPPGDTARLLVIHGISLPPGRFGGDAVERLFTNTLDCDLHPAFEPLRGLRVSAHFFIRRNGALLQFVPADRRAWHAGVSSWAGRPGCNDFSVGVELEGTDDVPYTAAQYLRLARLTRLLRQRYPIADIAGHGDIAPGRKTDPGPSFDWKRFRALLRVVD
jgi:N-acetyl-anhydromuramoyl-L-alanine amidase